MQKYRRRNTVAFTVLAYFTFFAGVFLFSIGLYMLIIWNSTKKAITSLLCTCSGRCDSYTKVTRDNAEDNEIIAEQEKRQNQSHIES